MKRTLLQCSTASLCMLAWASYAQATILTFQGTGTNSIIPDTFGDNVAAAATGISVANGSTPNIGLTWIHANPAANGQRWEFYNDSEWSASQLNNVYEASQHNLVFSPDVGFGVLVDSFVVDDYSSYKGGNQILWNLFQDSVGGTLIASGVADTADGQNLTVNTGMPAAYFGNVVLQIIGGDDPDDTVFGIENRALPGYQGIDDLAIDSISFQQVPEPGAMLLSIMAVIGVGVCARKQR